MIWPSLLPLSHIQRREQKIVAGFLFLTILGLVIYLELSDLMLTQSGDPDEGVYLLVARLLNSGYSYNSFFYDHFAFFPQLLAFALRVGGDSLLTGRLTNIVFSILALLGLAMLARLLSGMLAAIIILPFAALNQYYVLISRYTLGEAVCIACLVWALVAMFIYTHRQGREWLVLSAVLFTLSVLVKPLVIGFALTLVVWLCLGHRAPDPSVRRWNVKQIIIDVAFVVIVGFLTAAPFVNILNLSSEYERTAAFHLLQDQVYAPSFFARWNALVVFAQNNQAWLGLFLIGALVQCLRYPVITGALVVGELLTAVQLVQLPPFPHHYALLVPMLALFTALGFGSGISALRQSIVRLAGGQSDLAGGVTNLRARQRQFAFVLIFMLALGFWLFNLPQIASADLGIRAKRWNDRTAAINFLRKKFPPHTFLLGDDPALIYLAGDLVPPTDVLFLYDTTFDILPQTPEQLTERFQEYPVKGFVVTGPYRQHEVLMNWIKAHYLKMVTVGRGVRSVTAQIYSQQ